MNFSTDSLQLNNPRFLVDFASSSFPLFQDPPYHYLRRNGLHLKQSDGATLPKKSNSQMHIKCLVKFFKEPATYSPLELISRAEFKFIKFSINYFLYFFVFQHATYNSPTANDLNP